MKLIALTFTCRNITTQRVLLLRSMSSLILSYSRNKCYIFRYFRAWTVQNFQIISHSLEFNKMEIVNHNNAKDFCLVINKWKWWFFPKIYSFQVGLYYAFGWRKQTERNPSTSRSIRTEISKNLPLCRLFTFSSTFPVLKSIILAVLSVEQLATTLPVECHLTQ